ncbi:bacteriohemerythrin [Tichowtungia aerotolerans]|uniref:Bacteriohemerythrin n=1 Tax=Tichowtungia aerotolerans TaxID=2697043 RepID=A0A6P1MA85_9BACT|nr:bacteriohemerythrin [Tichowtungia aerotolerans]QHI69464.1 bacteriohemerythrin [Tichowtungia aerotolerans]
MEKINWTDKFNIGHPEIDRQHRQLIEMLNRLTGTPDVTTSSETVSDILHNMTQYAQIHFRTEENLLKTVEYPDLKAHKKEHLAYRKKIVDLCKHTMLGFHDVPEELLRYLHDWWSDHILVEDMKYRDFLQS